MSELLTVYGDHNGIEWSLKALYRIAPFEPATLEYPGCEAEIEITGLYRREYTKESNGTQTGWVLFEDESEQLTDHISEKIWEKEYA